MADNIDNVFVSLATSSQWAMPVLEWALDHFDSDKTKIILANFSGISGDMGKYLPRCAEKKFRAEILIPKTVFAEGSILEVLNKHGMNKLVCGALGWNFWISRWFDENSTICFKIWIVNENNGELTLVRDTRLYPGESATQKQMDELLQNEKDLHRRMVEQRPLREERKNLKEVDRLRKRETGQAEEVRQLNENISVLTMEKESSIKKLQKANEEMHNLESTKTNEIRLLRNEKELLTDENILLMDKHEDELRLTIEKFRQRIDDLRAEKLELETAKKNQDEQHKKDREMLLINEKEEMKLVQQKNEQMTNELKEQHRKDREKFHQKEKEEKDVLHHTIEEKEQNIKDLQEANDQMRHLESTKANEICHLKDEKELLRKNLEAEVIRSRDIEERLLLMTEQAEELRVTNMKWKQKISDLISEKEDHIQKLNEENKKKIELESTKATEIHLQRKEIKLLHSEIEWLNKKQGDNVSKLYDANEEKQNLQLAKVKEVSLLAKEIEFLKSKHEQELHKLFGDSERARNELELTLSIIKDRVVTLESDCSKLKDERDNAVKEIEKFQNLRECIPCGPNTMLSSDFTLLELEQATQNFSDLLKIGEGGFGCVYKGSFRGTTVAIKKLNSQSTQSISGFNKEVAILSTIRHPNIVTLLGACYDASALVFELLPNGSLESHLDCANKITSLTWQMRTRIISEICLALIFLHSNTQNIIIHGDLKPDNILLDVNFVSKLGDFGISRLIKQQDSGSTAFYETYNPIGTRGYIDPEFVTTGVLTEKSDVYSFGIIILRLLTRKPAMCIAIHVEDAIRNRTFREILDASAGEWPLDQAEELAKLAIRCAQIYRKARPNLLYEVWPIIERLRRNL